MTKPMTAAIMTGPSRPLGRPQSSADKQASSVETPIQHQGPSRCRTRVGRTRRRQPSRF